MDATKSIKFVVARSMLAPCCGSGALLGARLASENSDPWSLGFNASKRAIGAVI